MGSGQQKAAAWEPSEALNPDEEKAHMKQRRCTDIACLVVLLIALAFLGYVNHYAYQHGDLRRLYHGFDFMGNLCGIDVVERPYVFYCSDPLHVTQLDLEHPVCVTACPTSNETATACYERHSVTKIGTDAATGSFDEVFTYVFQNVQDYPTENLAGMYCTPTDTTFYKQMWTALTGSVAERFVLEAWELRHGWAVLLYSAGLAVVLSYIFLLLVKYLATGLVYTVLLLLTVGCVFVGVTLIGASQGHIDVELVNAHINNVGYSDTFLLPDTATGSRDLDLYLGIGCCAIGALVGIVAVCCRGQIQKAVDCLEVTSDCLMRMPILLLTPILTLIVQLALLVALLGGLLQLVSCGKVKHRTLAEFAISPVGRVGGVFRDIEFEDYEVAYIAFYVFMVVWLLEIVSALAQFMVIYAIQLWYFTVHSKDSKRPCSLHGGSLFSGFRIGLTYHLGTLGFGACLIAVTRTARYILMAIASQNGENGVGNIIAKVCSCCLACFERILKFVNKNAYMDVALSSSSFCTATRRAFKILTTNIPAVAVLNGMTWILQLAGTAIVTMGSVWLTYYMLWNLDTFKNPESKHYVPKPIDLCIIAGLINASIAWVFMVLLDTISDTILFCLVVDNDFYSLLGSGGSAARDSLPKLKTMTHKYASAQ